MMSDSSTSKHDGDDDNGSINKWRKESPYQNSFQDVLESNEKVDILCIMLL